MLSLFLSISLIAAPLECPEPRPVEECWAEAYARMEANARIERARRAAVEADLADTTASRNQWRDAASTAAAPVTPAWVWPVAAGLVLVGFIGGFVLAAEYAN
jgi:hypothetical protein